MKLWVPRWEDKPLKMEEGKSYEKMFWVRDGGPETLPDAKVYTVENCCSMGVAAVALHLGKVVAVRLCGSGWQKTIPTEMRVLA